MSKEQNRIYIANKITAAAKIYKAELVGKTFMYVFEDKFIEVLFRVSEFSHLTGVETGLSAKDFYKNALSGKLSHHQICFSGRHPYNLSLLKVEQLEHIGRMTNSELLVLENITTGTATYKFGITELAFTLCMDKDLDKSGVPKSDLYIAKSLRVEDSFDRCQNAFEVNFIFAKPNDQKKYGLLTYTDSKRDIESLSQEIQDKIRLCSE